MSMIIRFMCRFDFSFPLICEWISSLLMVSTAISISTSHSISYICSLIHWIISACFALAILHSSHSADLVSMTMRYLVLPFYFTMILSNILIWYNTKQDILKETVGFFLKDYQNILLLMTKYRSNLLMLVSFNVLLSLAHLLPLYAESTLILITAQVFNKIVYAVIIKTMVEDFLFSIHNLQDMEQKVSYSRRSFLRYIFHELRVPLNAILLGVQFLSDSNRYSDAVDKDLLTTIVESSSVIAETLSDILVLQKLESGAMKLIHKPYTISELISSVTGKHNEYMTIANLRGIKMEVTIHEQVPATVIGDKFRIAHVLSIILSNAIKFSPNNSLIRIVISVGARETATSIRDKQSISGKAGELLVFKIIDQGVGISESTLKTIFIPYLHTRPGDLKRGHGSGLSLAICKEIIDLHNGRISCLSTENLGSTFTIELPFQVFQGVYGERLHRALSIESIPSLLHASLDDSSCATTALESVLKSKEFRFDEEDVNVNVITKRVTAQEALEGNEAESKLKPSESLKSLPASDGATIKAASLSIESTSPASASDQPIQTPPLTWRSELGDDGVEEVLVQISHRDLLAFISEIASRLGSEDNVSKEIMDIIHAPKNKSPILTSPSALSSLAMKLTTPKLSQLSSKLLLPVDKGAEKSFVCSDTYPDIRYKVLVVDGKLSYRLSSATLIESTCRCTLKSEDLVDDATTTSWYLI
jgi:signal transduction histidine kinase